MFVKCSVEYLALLIQYLCPFFEQFIIQCMMGNVIEAMYSKMNKTLPLESRSKVSETV